MKRSVLIVFAVVVGVVAGLLSMQPQAVGQSKEPIKIGMIADSTGGLAAYGYSHEKVLRSAIKKINTEGGISGRPIELYVEDTESKPPVGALKFRKLVESNGVSFVIDSNSSGVAIACAPIAKELKTPYFPCAGATEISGENGNRYVFQPCTNVRQEAKGVAKFAAEKIGKKWVTVVVNYAWGWSNEKEFTDFIKQAGGEVLTSIRVPLGTGDWLPYLAGKIPKEAEAVYFANFGSDFLSFIRDLHAVRPDIKKLGAVYAISAQDVAKLGEAAEGLYCIAPYPTRYEGLKTDFNKAYRDMKTLSETEMLRRSQNIYRTIFAVLLTFSAVLFMILYRDGLLHGGLVLVLGIGLALSFAIVVPPIRLYTSGIGELVLSFLICNIIPAIAFLFQSSELHRLISMSTLPLTAIFMAVLIGAQFPSFAKDCTYCQSTILVRLGWQNGVGLHNMLILAVYVITGAAYFLGMPWRLVWPMLLTVPFAVYLIFQMNRISAGAKPGWLMFQLTGGALFLLAAYLLTFTYWTI